MRDGFRRRVFLWVFLLSLLAEVPAQAGMTVYGLSDIYRLRLQEISFFILLLLVCAFVLKLVWNHATTGFSFLPRIGFHQALCLSLMGGLTMLLILTMISGIREVLTPGAWRHQGTSYRLNAPAQEPARKRSLEHLRTALFDYAHTHGGRFPPHDFVAEIPEKLWESPDEQATHYLYTGGLSTNGAPAILATEPAAFGEIRFALMTTGQIEKLTSGAIQEGMTGPAQR